LRRRFSADPIWNEHPRIERRADDRAARDEFTELLIAELPHVRDQRAAVLMTRPDGAVKEIERVPKSVVAEVRRIKYQSEAVNLADEFATACN
jgi:hypothetical protein